MKPILLAERLQNPDAVFCHLESSNIRSSRIDRSYEVKQLQISSISYFFDWRRHRDGYVWVPSVETLSACPLARRVSYASPKIGFRCRPSPPTISVERRAGWWLQLSERFETKLQPPSLKKDCLCRVRRTRHFAPLNTAQFSREDLAKWRKRAILYGLPTLKKRQETQKNRTGSPRNED